MRQGKVKLWEASLLLALCVSLCHGVVQQSRLQRLGDNVIRLHVIAVDDSGQEQALKMQVQQVVCALVEPLLADCRDAGEAAAALEASLGDIRCAAEKAAGGRRVQVDFSPQYYGVREAEGIRLPAGEYQSLRVTIGEGAGHNWWGVIFPELSLDSASGYEDAVKLLGEDNVKLITQQGEGIEIRFRLLEWWTKLKALLS